MMPRAPIKPTRRALLSAGATAGGLLLSGCDRIGASAPAGAVFRAAETLTYRAQRLITDRAALAPEFTGADRSPVFRSNGTAMPAGADYAALLADGFRAYRLQVGGLVARPLSLDLARIGALPTRTQTTRHDCVEGWSAIATWTGVPLRVLLDMAGVSGAARFILFRCFDAIGGADYYETIDMVDARHPQTILAWALNGQPLPVQNGAPLRLRVERQLGYKHAKYVRSIEAVASLAGIGAGRGGYWEDVADYAWYAGI